MPLKPPATLTKPTRPPTIEAPTDDGGLTITITAEPGSTLDRERWMGWPVLDTGERWMWGEADEVTPRGPLRPGATYHVAWVREVGEEARVVAFDWRLGPYADRCTRFFTMEVEPGDRAHFTLHVRVTAG